MSKEQQALDFIGKNKALIVNTVGRDGYPNTRIFYSHANDGFTVYFSGGTKTEKTAEIAANPRVNAYYENTAQELSGWVNVTVYGDAEVLPAESAEYDKAVGLLSARSENFKKRVENGQLAESTIHKLIPKRVKLLDFAADPRVVEIAI